VVVVPGRHRQRPITTTIAYTLLAGLGVLICAGLLGLLTLALFVFLLSTP
jgi:hypothetical protein